MIFSSLYSFSFFFQKDNVTRICEEVEEVIDSKGIGEFLDGIESNRICLGWGGTCIMIERQTGEYTRMTVTQLRITACSAPEAARS